MAEAVDEAERELRSALDHHARGELDEAIRRYRGLLAAHPGMVGARHMLGLALHQQGRSQEAIVDLDHAVSAMPDDPRLRVNRSSVLLALGRLPEAESDARQALARQSADFGAHFNLGLVLEALNRLGEAEVAFLAALSARPDATAALTGLARCALRSGAASATRALAKLEAAPTPGLRRMRADLLSVAGRGQEAEREWAALLSAEGDSDGALRLRIAQSLIDREEVEAGLTHLRAILAVDPRHRDAVIVQAGALLKYGSPHEAVAEYERLLDRESDLPTVESGYLIALQYLPETTPTRLLEVHRRWAQRHAPPPAPAKPGRRRQRMRIAWISPRFNRGPVQMFFSTVLEALHRRGDAEHVLVMTGGGRDEATARFRASADGWVDAHSCGEDQLLETLRSLDADIAIDLAGHAPGGALRVLARRVAPLQVSWLDYFATTGVDAIDVLIGDSHVTPPGCEAAYTERIVRLSGSRLCYAPPPDAPAVGNIGDPARRSLLSFNRLSKIVPEVMSVWAELLRELPEWTLELRGTAYASADTRAHVSAAFASRGIDPARIRMHGFGSYADVLAAYRSGAVALDTWPFGGCATTCDALWMGVPVVSLRGDTFVSRQSASLLHSCGMHDNVVVDAAEYVRRVVRLASDPACRAAECADLRARARAALCDADRFATELLDVLRAELSSR